MGGRFIQTALEVHARCYRCPLSTARKRPVQTDADVDRLLAPEAGLIRHRGKIASVITNARLVLDVQQEHRSFATYLLSFLPQGRPIVNNFKCVIRHPFLGCVRDFVNLSHTLSARPFLV